jgi:hypothetical protein
MNASVEHNALSFKDALRRWRALFPLLRSSLWNMKFFTQLIGALLLGFLSTWACRHLLPAAAMHAIFAAFFLTLVGVGGVFFFLPHPQKSSSPASEIRTPLCWPAWGGLRAWICHLTLAGVLWSGWRLAPGVVESWRTAALFWALTAAYAALSLGVAGIFERFFPSRPQLGRACLTTAGLIVLGGFFWCRPFLEWESARILRAKTAAVETQKNDEKKTIKRNGEWIAERLLRLNPIFGAAAILRMESDAARFNDAGFDLVHSRMTYGLWLGSDRPLPYPRLLPGHDDAAARELGLLLTLFAWGLALILLTDAARPFFEARLSVTVHAPAAKSP